jgi:hypothetical protein
MPSALTAAEAVISTRVDPGSRARLEAYRARFDPPISRSRAIANLIAESLATFEPVAELPARLPRPRKPPLPPEVVAAKAEAKAARQARRGALRVGKRKKRPGISDDKPSQILLPREVPQIRGRLTLRQWVEKTFGPGPYTDEQQTKLPRAHDEAVACGFHQETIQYYAFMESLIDG